MLRLSSYIFSNGSGKWNKLISISLYDQICLKCLKLEDAYHFVIECSLVKNHQKQIYSWHPLCMTQYA